MYKNQLQELAQRSCFNLPSYSCIREGPDHAPRFKATVSFNGEVFESPGYHTTLRQAEHAAAEVALNTLSRRGPTQSLAARILDETGVCKNLLQETAQRTGVSLPVYTTIRSGAKHLPIFTCVVEVGGKSFVGEPAKTKKQAEKNAALAAWSVLKHLSPTCHLPLLLDSTGCDSRVNGLGSGRNTGKDDGTSSQSSFRQGQYSQRNRVRPVNVRDRNRLSREGNVSSRQSCPGIHASASASGTDALAFDRYQSIYRSNHSSALSSGETHTSRGSAWHVQNGNNDNLDYGHSGMMFYNATPGSLINSGRQASNHLRRHSLSCTETPVLVRDSMAFARASGGGSLGARVLPDPHRVRGLPYQSLSERFELNRPLLLEELQLNDDEDDWTQKDVLASSTQPHMHHAGRSRWQSQSERFEFRSHFLPQVEEVFPGDEEDWQNCEPVGINGYGDRENGTEIRSRCSEGWLRGENLLQSLEKQKAHGYKEGWLQEKIMKHSQCEQRHLNSDNWLVEGSVNVNADEASCSGNGHTSSRVQKNVLNTSRSTLGVSLGDVLEKERNCSYINTVKDSHIANKGASRSNPVGPIGPSSSSPFSSLWAKSTQWWASHRSTGSSSAAAIASSLGLRPASSMAPAVRVRQMVPVCSAPPPRRAESSALSCHSLFDHSSNLEDAEANVQQVFNSLRL
ncbi:hypothetical protein KP509_19G020000 [Ceratopteris richardii]|uniref:DRBM domain-containing protein n=1 Tax=Ceratopteris richardii TaxID=49495 RepID=A0A8T2SM29_CERRI|nr:hypothetical protein KP509_19G020000 [Ceratopteris richardii]KAH7351913.1 hypothetical protein KP509_19G020000 [Ceratopteris richardii]